MFRKKRYPITIALFIGALASFYLLGIREAPERPPQTYNAELQYLKTLHEKNAAGSPAITFALMAEYLNSGQHREGIRFFESLLTEDGKELPQEKRALFLGSLGVLRGAYSGSVPLLKRIAWVNETIDILESARKLTKNESFGIRWMTGVVYAQLPDRFKKSEQGRLDLQWLLANAGRAPEPGMLREVYFQLASLHRRAGEEEKAKRYLSLSGYGGFERPIMLISSYAVNARRGHTFHPRKLVEIIPGKVFALSGFEFTEYYFIVSKDGSQLISIDAGTRPDSAKAAYEFLLAKLPGLPPLTTVFVTHAHWDHIGGHRYFRRLNPEITFFIRDNYRDELRRVKRSELNFTYFFGSEFSNDLVTDFTPDRTVSRRRKITVGGTLFELIPVPGGETPDGLFIYLPEYDTVFVGDFIMPYLGAPFVEEGSLPGLLRAIDLLAGLKPRNVLHGHETLTRRFNPPSMLKNLGEGLAWLGKETLGALESGTGRAGIHHLNLIPPAVYDHPETQFIYLVMRENVINRLVDQHTGYWSSDLTGMDHLNERDFGSLLSAYLGLTEKKIAAVVREMIARGDHELAGRTASWGLARNPASGDLRHLKKRAFLKLKEKYQLINPFKTIIYSEVTGYEVPQLELPD